ncbi:cell adhesion molecule 4, partial [Heliangelus exortis]|uniref:cell adhesion molecule 4 n=1 Tax=Heliangelus exortis TaxID=472823 RepID=UPI003A8F798C
MSPPPSPPPLLLRGLLLLSTIAQGAPQEVHAQNVTVLEGGTAEITCELHSYDGSIVVLQNPARQTLFFNGTRALKDERFQLVEFSRRRLRLRLSRAQLEDEGGYYCQLYADDTHHQIATLTVLVPPGPPQVQASPALEGSELELRCLVPRARPPPTLRWYRGHRELAGSPSRLREGKVFRVLSVLRLRVERGDHGAIVTCEASHPALPRGTRRVTHHALDVQYAPTARIQPSQSVLREGDTLVLTCAVTANPPPSAISWSRLNESLPAGAVQEGSRLVLPALGPGDNGSYSCSAGNAHGRGTDTYVLVVYDPGAVVSARGAVPFAIVGGSLALLVFLLLLLLGALVWCSIRQK